MSPARRHGTDPVMNYSGEKRKEHGCICTFENVHGRRLVLHRAGRDYLRAACDDALSVDPTFRLIAYSTPTTIYTDLQGARLYHGSENRGVALSGRGFSPEAVALSQIGRIEMLHPRLDHSDGPRRPSRRRAA